MPIALANQVIQFWTNLGDVLVMIADNIHKVYRNQIQSSERLKGLESELSTFHDLVGATKVEIYSTDVERVHLGYVSYINTSRSNYVFYFNKKLYKELDEKEALALVLNDLIYSKSKNTFLMYFLFGTGIALMLKAAGVPSAGGKFQKMIGANNPITSAFKKLEARMPENKFGRALVFSILAFPMTYTGKKLLNKSVKDSDAKVTSIGLGNELRKAIEKQNKIIGEYRGVQCDSGPCKSLYKLLDILRMGPNPSQRIESLKKELEDQKLVTETESTMLERNSKLVKGLYESFGISEYYEKLDENDIKSLAKTINEFNPGSYIKHGIDFEEAKEVKDGVMTVYNGCMQKNNIGYASRMALQCFNSTYADKSLITKPMIARYAMYFITLNKLKCKVQYYENLIDALLRIRTANSNIETEIHRAREIYQSKVQDYNVALNDMETKAIKLRENNLEKESITLYKLIAIVKGEE